MPSPLETLVKILKLEQSTGFQNKAVIGGLGKFATEWVHGAHAQAKKPEHHRLVDELVALMEAYASVPDAERPDELQYMLARITGREKPRPGTYTQQTFEQEGAGTLDAGGSPPAAQLPRVDEGTPNDGQPAQRPLQGKQPPEKPRRPERNAGAATDRSADKGRPGAEDRARDRDTRPPRGASPGQPNPPNPARPPNQPAQAGVSPRPNAGRGTDPRGPREPGRSKRGNDSHSLFGDRTPADLGARAPTINEPIIEDEGYFEEPASVAARADAPALGNDASLSSLEQRTPQLPTETITPPGLESLILEPVPGFEGVGSAAGDGAEGFAIRPPRPRVPPPRRRRDTRTLAEKLSALAELERPVNMLHGVGPKLAEKLASLEIRTVRDLLFTFPRRYDDYTAMKPLNRLRPGELVSATGTVRSAVVIKGKRNIDIFNVVIDDGAGVLTASFFNQPYLRNRINKGDQVVFSGKIDQYLGRNTINNPHWEFVDQDALTTRTIVPVYPLTASLSPANLRKATDAALDVFGDSLPDAMPDSVLDRTGMAEYSWAIRQLHRPDSMEMLEHARERLMFDDLILLQIGVLRNRRAWQTVPADPLPVDDGWSEAFKMALPYPLTGAQTRAIAAIRADVARSIPMNRLLQGDVGSGKTVVAVAALAMAVANGHQGALMAPTGILAEQHYRGLTALMRLLPEGERINIKLLTSATPAQERAETLWGLGEGTVDILIGTHALLQEDVNFQNLGVAVIDEQHRFGVEQRGRLRGKGKNPHILVMTATPIPRTLALTMYADLDLTVLDEMPPGRTPIETVIAQPRQRERVYTFMRAQIAAGRQAFIVYPLVEASESDALAEVKSAIEDYEKLRAEVFPDLRIGLLHGRMSAAEKDAVMREFKAGAIDILVSTAVVEVGIDVPNASIMLIEGANRFGLAQLHQFRGRVGRGQHESYCVLIADNAAEAENPRLKALAETGDGYKLAEIDWKLRGAGELLGTRQSGAHGLSLASFMTPHIVELAQAEARALYAEDPALALPEHTLLRSQVVALYGQDPTTEVS